MLADDEFLRLGPIKSSDNTVCDVQTNIIHLKWEVSNYWQTIAGSLPVETGSNVTVLCGIQECQASA